jgi:hypothetical protein
VSKERECDHKDGEGFCFGQNEPDYVASVPVEQRAVRVLMDSDLCIVDDRHFFIRGCLEIPIVETQSTFMWLVWVSLSEKSFNRTVDLWETPARVNEPPYFGWLNCRIPGYPDTTQLKVNVHEREVGKRPAIETEPTDHPLAIEQREGITRQRAESLAKLVALEWS